MPTFNRSIPSFKSEEECASDPNNVATLLTPPPQKKSRDGKYQSTLTQYDMSGKGSEKKSRSEIVDSVDVETALMSELTKLDRGDICVATAMSLNHKAWLLGPVHPCYLVLVQVEAFERKTFCHANGVEVVKEKAKVNMMEIECNGRTWASANTWIPVSELMKLTHRSDNDLKGMNGFFVEGINHFFKYDNETRAWMTKDDWEAKRSLQSSAFLNTGESFRVGLNW